MLNFWKCKRLSGLIEVWKSLGSTKQLRHLVLDFKGCKRLGQISELGQSLQALRYLEHLIMDFSGCSWCCGCFGLSRRLARDWRIEELREFCMEATKGTSTLCTYKETPEPQQQEETVRVRYV